MTPRVVRLPDQDVAYVDHGSGVPVVLLHGGGLDHRMWAPQMNAFPGHRVIAPDARGHGGSSSADTPFRLVDDVVGLLDALGLSEAVVVGLSMGGGTAVDLAVEYPDRVLGLVVSGTGTSDPEFRDPWVLDIQATWQRAVQERDPEAWVEGFARFLPGPHRGPDDVDPALVEANDTMIRHTLTTHVLPLVAQGRMPEQPTAVERVNDRRRGIDVPVLAITGDLDADDHRRLTRELLDCVTDGREVVVPGTAHYPNLERPDLFNRAVADVLQGLAA